MSSRTSRFPAIYLFESSKCSKIQMLESHHLISSLISLVTISHSRYRPWVQLLFEHLGLSYLKLFFENWGYFSVRWVWQLLALTTAPVRHQLVMLKRLSKKLTQPHRAGDL